MTEREFTSLCKRLVADHYNNSRAIGEKCITADDVQIVWECKTLQNNKALAINGQPDQMYYEVTRNGDKGETYLDVYKMQENIICKE